MNDILGILEEIAAISSKNEKIACLKRNSDNTLLRDVCKLAYDPTINFFIKNLNSLYSESKSESTLQLQTALDMLKNITSRVHTGNHARMYLSSILDNCSVRDAQVVSRVVARDLRCGFGATTINKVWKNLIPEYPYQRCSLHTKVDVMSWDWKSGVFSQLKADGMYVNVNHELDGSVSIISRNGSLFPNESFSSIIADVKFSVGLGEQLHGELLIVDRDTGIQPREVGNGILNSIQQGSVLPENQYIIMYVWDMIPLENAVPGGVYSVPYSSRYDNIVRTLSIANSIKVIPTKIIHSYEHAINHYSEMLREGFEGTVIKAGSGVWKDGTSTTEVKLKLDVVVDLKITGFTAGNGKFKSTFGAITATTSDSKLIVNVSGISDKIRNEVSANRDNYLGTVVAIKSNNITKTDDNTYSLFLPRVVEFRTDKTTADSLDDVIHQFESAKGLA
jgi:DNA ligase-1